MPELPEVQTTVNGLMQTIIGLTISDVWTDYNSPYFTGSETIKDPAYFKKFKKNVIGKKVTAAGRRAKNILIYLEKGPLAALAILVHMKMTGHLLFGRYVFDKKAKKDPWQPIKPESLKDPFNRHVHFVISFSNGKQLALSDVRKFAKVALIGAGPMGPGAQDMALSDAVHLKDIGPEPLEPVFTLDKFAERLHIRPQGKIKQVLMDQTIIAGIGNIYADESLWRGGIHPLQKVKDIPPALLKKLFQAIRKTLSRGINFGGDSTSDYRNVDGERGEFHEHHRAYQRTGDICDKPGCGGRIVRIVLGGRGTHFCERHQKLLKAR